MAVALASAHVLIYDDKNIIDHFKVGFIPLLTKEIFNFLLFYKQENYIFR